MTRKGIDVSHWQGTIDWNKIKKAGIEFAIIKAGGSDAGFYTDSKWEANYKGAKAAGIPIGAYYFVGKEISHGVNISLSSFVVLFIIVPWSLYFFRIK